MRHGNKSCRGSARRSGRSLVFVDEAAEDLVTTHVTGRWPTTSPTLKGRAQLQSAVGPLAVVVLDVSPKHPLEVAAVEDQQPVQALGPHGANPPLGVGAGSRRSHRRRDDLGALAAEDIIEGAGELRVPVPNENSR